MTGTNLDSYGCPHTPIDDTIMVIRGEISSLNHITARSFDYMMCLKADEINVEWRMRYPPQENVAGPKYKLCFVSNAKWRDCFTTWY